VAGKVDLIGFLVPDEGKTKHSVPNDLKNNKFFFVDLPELCALKSIPNKEAEIGLL
jgi:hypothetical protein